jgi:hypothetical protein
MAVAMKHFRALVGGAALAAITAAGAAAQTWPARPIRMIVPTGPGSAPTSWRYQFAANWLDELQIQKKLH